MKKLALFLAAFAMLTALTACKGEAQQTLVWELEAKGVLIPAEGESIDRWRSHTEWASSGTASLPADYVDYRLSDGTVLMTEYDPVAPLLDDELGEDVQAAILFYYNSQGKLYEIEPLLRGAYEAYQRASENFEAWAVRQETVQTAQSESTLWFCTSVSTPMGSGQNTVRHYGAVFDRATGEELSLWSLFTVPEEKAKAALLSGAQGTGADMDELQAALTADMVAFYPDHTEVSFPAGSLAGEEQALTVATDMDDIAGLLQPWAVPQSESANK